MTTSKANIPSVNFFRSLGIVISLILLSYQHVGAQVTAAFSVPQTEGCVPLNQIEFTNNSTGPYTYAKWVFENSFGSETTIEYPNGPDPVNTNPKFSYITPGLYSITLIVSDGLDFDTLIATDYISVFPNPIANFTLSSNSGCTPFEIELINTSSTTSGGFTDITWSFGDGNSDTTSFDSLYHTFPTPLPNTNVVLNITDSNGCIHDTSNIISVYQTPDMDFIGSITSTCELPAPVDFQANQTTMEFISQYNWDFGNDSTSNQSNPTVTYLQNGIYDVYLDVVTSNGCVDTIVKQQYIQVGQIDAQISFNKDTFCRGEQLVFVSNAADAISYEWIFENLDTINTPSGSFIIPDSLAGWLRYQLIISSIASCTDTIIDSVLIDTVAINFSTLDPQFYCNPTANVMLQGLENSITGIQSWLWNLNGVTDSVQNPNYALENYGYYDASLTVTSNGGCVASASQDSMFYIFDAFPTVTQTSQTSGCEQPFITLQFNPATAPQSNIIDSWIWDTDGDGDTDNEALGPNSTGGLLPFNPPNFDTLVFDVILHIDYTNGCTRSDTVNFAFGESPSPNFSASADTICAEDMILLTDLSSSTTPITGWEWSFSEGGSSQAQNPSYMFTDTGYIDIKLVVTSNGCSDSLTIDSMVYVSAPRITVAVEPIDCDNPLDAEFTLTNTGANRWDWFLDYDAGFIESDTLSLTHTFPNGGTYTGSVVAHNDVSGCEFTASFSVDIFQYTLNLASSIPDTSCVGSPIPLNVSSINNNVQYNWYTGDGDSIINNSGPLHYYDTAGNYNISVIALSPNTCIDTSTTSITIGSLESYFTMDTTRGCTPVTINFTDSSTSTFGIESWSWDFADSTIDSIASTQHTFSSPGSYDVSLTIIDSSGCTNLFERTVSSYSPISDFTLASYTNCIETEVSFNNSSSNNSGYPLLYNWDFGDGNYSTQTNPTHIYTDTGIFSVTLVSSDFLFGCKDTVIFDSIIAIQSPPEAGFFANPTQIGCSSTPTVFTDTSNSDFPIISWDWNYGDGSQGGILEISQHQYTTPGTYDVQLIIQTLGGCADTVLQEDLITVNGPYIEFSLSSDSICRGGEVTFTLDSLTQVVQTTIDFGDANISDSIYDPNQIIAHTYSQGFGHYYPIITIWSDTSANNECKVAFSSDVYIYEVISMYHTSDTILCNLSPSATLTSTSSNADSLIWDLGDGSSVGDSSIIDHQYNYTDTTFYTSLIVFSDEFGCSDTSYQTIAIGNLINAIIPSDTFMCIGDSMHLFANSPGLDSISWQSTSYFETLIDSTHFLSIDSNHYNVQLFISDTNGCNLNHDILVEVISPAEASFNNPINYLSEGDSYQFDVGFDPTGSYHTYEWTPSESLSCTSCLNPLASPLETTQYILNLSDSLSCFSAQHVFNIQVVKEPTLELPTTFTPNGDLNNDIIYAKGLGLVKLLEFNVYNRWGELIYKNHQDLLQGWDGTYKGNLQAAGSYAYTLKGEAFTGEIIEKKGYIELVR